MNHGRPLETLLATFGISLFLQQLVRTIFTANNRPVSAPSWMSGQLEISAALLMTTSREEFIAQVSQGLIPEKAEEGILRVRRCVEEVVAALPSVLAPLHGS